METKIKGAGRDKPDLQLTYWNDWAIFDPAKQECLVSFAPAFFKGYAGNIDKICEDIKRYPEQALRDPVIWNQIAFIRENEKKGRLPHGSFDKILKAMKIDRRRYLIKVDGALLVDELGPLISHNLKFFLKILSRGIKTSIEKSIHSYIDAVDPTDEDRQAFENYKRIYKAYKKAYDKLTQPETKKLTPKEAIHFFEVAGQNINRASYYQAWRPGKRDLIYAKGQHIISCHLQL